jgi:membrane protein implicated in regulation of membrane protease activity
MMDIITQNLAQSLLIFGLVLLVVEVLVLGFSTFFMFFIGLGFIITALFFFSDVFEPNMVNALISISIVSGLSAVLLWQPLKKMQNSVGNKKVDSDIIGYQFQLEEELLKGSILKHQFSGVSWKVSSDQDIAQGETVEVAEVGVGKMKVKRVLSANA